MWQEMMIKIFLYFFEKALDYFSNRSIISIVDREVDMHH